MLSSDHVVGTDTPIEGRVLIMFRRSRFTRNLLLRHRHSKSHSRREMFTISTATRSWLPKGKCGTIANVQPPDLSITDPAHWCELDATAVSKSMDGSRGAAMCDPLTFIDDLPNVISTRLAFFFFSL